MTQEQDFVNCRRHWFMWNLEGKGKETHSSGKYRYDGPIFYIEDTPSQRLTKGKRGWVLTARYGTPEIPDWAKKKVIPVLSPDLAVLSKFSGDWYEEADDVHGRVKFIMLKRAELLCDDAEASNAKQFEKASFVANFDRALKRYYHEWEQYDIAFGLGWGPMPQFYNIRLQDIMREKQRSWNDPSAVMRRERAAARKSAKKALGLN